MISLVRVDARGLRESGREFCLIEGGCAAPGFSVHQDEFLRAARQTVAVPEAGVVLEPVRRDARFVNVLAVLPALPPLGLLLRAGRNNRAKQQQDESFHTIIAELEHAVARDIRAGTLN